MGNIDCSDADLLDVAMVSDGAEHESIVDLVEFSLVVAQCQQQQTCIISESDYRAAFAEV